jgi:hypothetical protein
MDRVGRNIDPPLPLPGEIQTLIDIDRQIDLQVGRSVTWNEAGFCLEEECAVQTVTHLAHDPALEKIRPGSLGQIRSLEHDSFRPDAEMNLPSLIKRVSRNLKEGFSNLDLQILVGRASHPA